MKQKTAIVDGVERRVFIFRWDEWRGGIQGDDLLHTVAPDRYIFVRDGDLFIVDDTEHASLEDQ